MAKDVKLNIGINTEGLKQATRGANDAQKSIYSERKSLLDKELAANKQALEAITSLRKRSAEQIARANVQTTNEKIRNLNKEVAAVESAERRIASAQNQRGKMILKAGGLGMQGMGQTQAGYLMRMSGVSGIGTSSVGGMSSAALGGVGVALTGVMIASKLVEVGLEMLSSVVTSTAGAFMGAIASIGGARGLQEDIEAAAKHQSQTNAIRMMVTPEERAPAKDIDQWAAKMASRADLGGFTSEQWRTGLGEYGENSGLQKSFMADTQASDFAGRMALISKDKQGESSPAHIMKMMAILQSQNPDMSHQDIQKIILSGAGIGQHGSFSIGALLEHPDLLQETSALGGDASSNYSSVFGLASIIKKRTGNLGEATTQITGLERALGRTHQQHIKGKSSLELGTWKGGQLQNLDEAVIQAASMNPDTLAVQGSGWERTEAKEAIANIRKQAGVTSDDDQEQARAKIQAMIDAERSYIITQNQMNDMVKDSVGIYEKLKSGFNSVNDTISGAFQPVLTKTVKVLEPFFQFLSDNKDSFSNAIKQMSDIIINALPSLLAFGLVVAEIAAKAGKVAIKGQEAVVSVALGSAITSRDATRDTLYYDRKELETGKYQAGINKGKPISEEERKRMEEIVKKGQTYLEQKEADVVRLEKIAKSLHDMPKAVDDSVAALQNFAAKFNLTVAGMSTGNHGATVILAPHKIPPPPAGSPNANGGSSADF